MINENALEKFIVKCTDDLYRNIVSSNIEESIAHDCFDCYESSIDDIYSCETPTVIKNEIDRVRKKYLSCSKCDL
jgi:hypothetical protein